jgi:chaperonin GroES
MAQKKKAAAKKAAKKTATKTAKPAVKKASGLQPMHDFVLLKPEAAETKTPSGIIIPDTAKQEKSTIGRVIAVGEGRYGDEGDLIPMRTQKGDKVYFSPGWENEVEYAGEKYFLVRDTDVKAIIND